MFFQVLKFKIISTWYKWKEEYLEHRIVKGLKKGLLIKDK